MQRFFWKAVEVARNFKPISSAENETLAKTSHRFKACIFAQDGLIRYYDMIQAEEDLLR